MKCHELLTWKDAERKCNKEEGHLASVEDAAENDFIFKMIGDEGVWIGAIKSKSSGKWKWTDSTSWNYTMPLPYTSYSLGVDDICLGMRIETYNDWNEESCNDQFYPICK